MVTYHKQEHVERFLTCIWKNKYKEFKGWRGTFATQLRTQWVWATTICVMTSDSVPLARQFVGLIQFVKYTTEGELGYFQYCQSAVVQAVMYCNKRKMNPYFYVPSIGVKQNPRSPLHVWKVMLDCCRFM